ncbi:hypothetical protein [Jeotgalibaca porci]|uniref:hypothetical protein n=1 Tax=Jeotgalibaca porci TaxID=1868793 RepID=UPI00359FE116
MNMAEITILVVYVSVVSFILGNIFNNSLEKRYYQKQRNILHKREQKMRRQYRDMENALAVAKGYKPDEEEREAE